MQTNTLENSSLNKKYPGENPLAFIQPNPINYTHFVNLEPPMKNTLTETVWKLQSTLQWINSDTTGDSIQVKTAQCFSQRSGRLRPLPKLSCLVHRVHEYTLYVHAVSGINWVSCLIRTSRDKSTQASRASLLPIVITVLKTSLRPCMVSSDCYPVLTKMKATDTESKQHELRWVAFKICRSCSFTSVLLIPALIWYNFRGR